MKDIHTDLTEKTLVVVPAYNAHKTINKVIDMIISVGYVNIIISDDDSGIDITKHISNYPETVIYFRQSNNLGYGGNQKFLYNYALLNDYEYVIMIHGDFQYTPSLIPPMISMLHYSKYDFVFGSRFLGGNPLKNGMPFVRYLANKLLTCFQNIITGYNLSEYHSGLRAYSRHSLESLDYNKYSNNFIFDNQILIGLIERKMKIGELSCVTKYDQNSSSITISQCVVYALGVIKTTLIYFFRRLFF